MAVQWSPERERTVPNGVTEEPVATTAIVRKDLRKKHRREHA